MADKIADLRKEYTRASLDIESANPDPFQQFEQWFNEAKSGELLEPNAMVVSTVDENGQPFQRTVLMKALDKDGIVFYTNYKSRKAEQIATNHHVSLLFPWYSLERQVAIQGIARKVSTKESLN